VTNIFIKDNLLDNYRANLNSVNIIALQNRAVLIIYKILIRAAVLLDIIALVFYNIAGGEMFRKNIGWHSVMILILLGCVQSSVAGIKKIK